MSGSQVSSRDSVGSTTPDQLVNLMGSSSLDSLPMNSYFPGLLDLGDETSVNLELEALMLQKKPPLRQPFYNGMQSEPEKKLPNDVVSPLSPTLSPYVSVWRTPTSDTNIWRNRFDLAPNPLCQDVLKSGEDCSTNCWQTLDGNSTSINDEVFKGAFGTSHAGAAAIVSPSPAISASWSSVVGSKPTQTLATQGFLKTKSGTCSCDDRNPVTSRCRECNEDICDFCVDAHQRVSLTRNHVIVRYPDNSGHAIGSVSNSSIGVIQPPSSSQLFGMPRDSDVMKVYVDAVEKAKSDCEKLLVRAKQGCSQIDEALTVVSEMEAQIDIRHATMFAEVKTLIENCMAEIQDRGKFLLTRLDNIHTIKMNTLAQQKRELSASTAMLVQISDQLASCMVSGREIDLINTSNKALSTVKEVQQKCGNLMVQEDDLIFFEKPGPELLKSIANFGFVGGSAFASNSQAEGEGLKKGTLGKDARFVIYVRDQLNEQLRSGGDFVKVNIVGPDGRQVFFNMADGMNGTFRVIWKPSMEGEHIISITIKDRHIQESPFRTIIRAGRNYRTIDKPLFTFGIEGKADGDLCRPWGVCCSKEGFIIVANRSNDRIEVFTPKGIFHHKFGTSGKQNGQFNRPASVCCDKKNRIIVTDKDNHRVQIFSIHGEFLLPFGEKGSKPGQFNYPWDVACNSKDQILVSDTRNHRIQLFSPNGDFINKYGFEGAMWKHFDSPRGVCFTADDQAVITDFNNHRLLVVKADFQMAKFLGKEGTEDGSFTRPNGVAVDEDGYIFVADSRNDRVQVFTPNGQFLKKFGLKGNGPGEFDRPSGICISPAGEIIVVDFGNNRVQVF